MRTVYEVAILAAGGALLTTAVALATSNDAQVAGSYATLAACQADGPHMESTHNDGTHTRWDCRQDPGGVWYLHLTN